LKQFGTVEKLFDGLEKVKSERLRAALLNAKDAVRRNRELVRLHNVECDFSVEAMAVKAPDMARLRELYSRWGFKTLLAAVEESMRGEQQAALI